MFSSRAELVALVATRPKKSLKGAQPFPVVNVKGGAAVMGATYGTGRVVVSSDISMFAPLRVDKADNAALLANVLGWLLRREADDAFRARVKGDLFLDETCFNRIREEERR